MPWEKSKWSLKEAKADTNCRIPHLGWIWSAVCGVGFDVFNQQSLFSLFPSAPVPSEFIDSICFLETRFFFFNLSGEREKCLRNTNELLLSGTLLSHSGTASCYQLGAVPASFHSPHSHGSPVHLQGTQGWTLRSYGFWENFFPLVHCSWCWDHLCDNGNVIPFLHAGCWLSVMGGGFVAEELWF